MEVYVVILPIIEGVYCLFILLERYSGGFARPAKEESLVFTFVFVHEREMELSAKFVPVFYSFDQRGWFCSEKTFDD